MSIKISKTVRKVNPIISANIINRFTFWWLKDLFIYGSKNDLKSEDLYDTLDEDKSEKLGSDLEKAWLKKCEYAQKNKSKPSFSKCAFKIYGREFFKYAIFYFLMAILQIIQPLTLAMVIPYFYNPPKVSGLQAYFFATVSALLLIVSTTLRRYGYYKLANLGMRIKIACSSLIYRKILRLSNSFKSHSAPESMINLLSNDLQRFEMFFCNVSFVLIVPIQVILTLYLMSPYIGITAACVAISTVLLQALPVQAIYYKLNAKLRLKQTSQTDRRVSAITEIVNAIRIIKVYAWEYYFKSLVFLLRNILIESNALENTVTNTFFSNEIVTYMNMYYASSVTLAMKHFVHRWSIFFLTLICIFQNNVLISIQIIPVVQYLSNLRQNIIGVLSESIKTWADIVVTIKRLETFLAQKEIDCTKVQTTSDDSDNKSIRMKEVKLSWNCKNNDEILKDINLEIDHGKLYVVIGHVGCGKSSLLKLILGEIKPQNGNIFINGKLSYASQEPWLFNGSIRENIIFRKDYNKVKYEQVINACALEDDLVQLPYGDKTLVGEKGTALSGGQCARINLARAVYRNADIYLLDDCLSAVDGRVAKTIFDTCINGLLKDKTRILVTHNSDYLNRAHGVVLIYNGMIQYQGSPTMMSSLKLNWGDLDFNETKKSINDRNSIAIVENVTDLKDKLTKNENENSEPQENEEFIAKRSTQKSMIFNYVKASKSYFYFPFWIFSSILVILLCAGFDYCLVLWAQQQEMQSSTNFDITKSSTNYSVNSFLMSFGSLIIIITVMSILKNIALFKFMLSGNKNIHNAMFDALIQTPLKFFETNPSGRIMNRFSEDVGAMDDSFIRQLSLGWESLIETFIFLLPVLIVNWWHSISMIIIGFLILIIYNSCAPVLRGVIRLSAVAKSPVLSCAITSDVGKETIRSQDAEEVMIKIFNSRQDDQTAAYSLLWPCFMAFAAWLDSLTNLLFIFVIYVSLIFKSNNESASFIGLALVQISNLSIYISIAVRYIFFSTSSHLVNLGRMFQVTKLNPEQCSDNVTIKLSKSWPTSGEIQFVGLYLKYSDDEQHILKNLNIKIESQMKVGVVGRTGAGKSSLISALFQLAKVEGTILIDGIDTKQISLKELRSKISIIPQEPILFSTSLRNNLDPFNEYDDATLWAALDSVELKKIFSSLDYTIEKNGCNMSLGQKQLVCLARAILRNNKILILDEATANVDARTDALIQKTIRVKFNNCTVITIAHRLNTVMDSDKILVMDNGQVVEYDSPDELLKNSNGHFYKMVRQINVGHEKNH